jgi:disulfide bond formation protein DsbB
MNFLGLKQAYLLAQLNILALCGVLLGAFGFQILANEIPCPLCVLQRVGFMLCAISMSVLLYAVRDGKFNYSLALKAHALSILCAVLGNVVAIRQILLHILPGDQGFGSPVLGLHLYTWSFVTFSVQIVASAFTMLALNPQSPTVPSQDYGRLARLSEGLLLLIVVANLVSIFASAGFAWELPGDPTQYLLFKAFK